MLKECCLSGGQNEYNQDLIPVTQYCMRIYAVPIVNQYESWSTWEQSSWFLFRYILMLQWFPSLFWIKNRSAWLTCFRFTTTTQELHSCICFCYAVMRWWSVTAIRWPFCVFFFRFEDEKRALRKQSASTVMSLKQEIELLKTKLRQSERNSEVRDLIILISNL